MALPATDSFAQSTGSPVALTTYSGNWTILEGGILVQSGTGIFYGTAGDHNTARWNADVFAADQYAQVRFTASMISAGVYAGPAVRCQSGANTSYHLDCNGSNYYLSKCVAGSDSSLVSAESMSLAAGDVVRLEVTTVGADVVLKVFRALNATPTTFVQFGTDYTDTAAASPILTAGYGGIFTYSNAANIGMTSFTAGNLGAAGTPTLIYKPQSIRIAPLLGY